MPAVTLVHDMDANQETVWNAWADFGNIAEFHPGLKGSRIIRGQETAQPYTAAVFESYKNWLSDPVEITKMRKPLLQMSPT